MKKLLNQKGSILDDSITESLFVYRQLQTNQGHQKGAKIKRSASKNELGGDKPNGDECRPS